MPESGAQAEIIAAWDTDFSEHAIQRITQWQPGVWREKLYPMRVVTHFEVPRPSWPCPFTGGTPVALQTEALPR